MKKFLSTIIAVILLTNTVFAEAAVIYAPVKPKEPEASTIISPSTNYDTNAPGGSVYNGINEDPTQVDYVNMYNVKEDSNGNLYCINVDGSQTKNAWRKISKHLFDSFCDTEGFRHEYIWAFFGSNGRMIKASSGHIKKQKIGNNTYAFNEYGQLLEGYFNEEGEMWNWDSDEDPLDLNEDSDTYLYYSNPENGILQSGWHQFLEYTDKYERKDFIWLYFNPDNFRSVKALGNTYKKFTINNKDYAFDNLGVMLTGFEAMRYNEESGGTISQIKYFNADGSIASNGFISVDLNNQTNEERYEDYLDYEDDITIYLNKNGVMYKNQMRKINGSYYGFDPNGVVLKNCMGIWNNGSYVDTIFCEETDGYDFIINNRYSNKQGNTKTYTSGQLYYFDKNGKRQDSGTIMFEDENYTYKGLSSGACEGQRDKKFYVHGLLMKPIDEKYGIYLQGANSAMTYSASEIYGNVNAYVVNKSGAKQTSSSALKDDNDYYWLVSSSGNLIGIYTEKVKRDGSKLYWYNENTSKWIEFDGNSHRASLNRDYCLNFKCR